MRIAVLGATGPIGCALVPLLAEEHEVVALSRGLRARSWVGAARPFRGLDYTGVKGSKV
jgi:nucleoside-diphosphate-sugar epimerase